MSCILHVFVVREKMKFQITFKRAFVVGLSMRRPGFDAGRVEVRFVVNKLVME